MENSKELDKFEVPQIIRENKRSFIQIPQFDAVIAIEQTHNGKNMYQQLEALASERMKMPPPAQFMTYRENARKAARGENQLLYADGTEVSRNISKDIWKRLSSGHKGNCWVNLNALFTKEEQNWKTVWYVETELQVIEDKLKGKREPLDLTTLHEDCYASLKFNLQGLAIERSPKQSYYVDENIYFCYPKNGTIAGFGASSGRVYLDCDWYPSISGSSLGVSASAEGAKQIAKILYAGGRR